VATFVTLTVLPAALSLVMQFEQGRVSGRTGR